MVQIGSKSLMGLGVLCIAQAQLTGYDRYGNLSLLGKISHVAGGALIVLGLAQPSSREFFRHPIVGLQGFGRGVAKTANSVWGSKWLTPVRGAWWVYSTAYKYNTIHALLSLGIANIAGLDTLRAGRGPIDWAKAQLEGIDEGLLAEAPSKVPGNMDRDDSHWAKIGAWMFGKWFVPSLLKIAHRRNDGFKPQRVPHTLFVPTIRIHGDPASLEAETNAYPHSCIREVIGPISADYIGISGAAHQAIEHRGGWFARVKARPYAPLVGAGQLFAGIGMLYTSGLAARVIANLPTIPLFERFRNMGWKLWFVIQLWSV